MIDSLNNSVSPRFIHCTFAHSFISQLIHSFIPWQLSCHCCEVRPMPHCRRVSAIVAGQIFHLQPVGRGPVGDWCKLVECRWCARAVAVCGYVRLWPGTISIIRTRPCWLAAQAGRWCQLCPCRRAAQTLLLPLATTVWRVSRIHSPAPRTHFTAPPWRA